MSVAKVRTNAHPEAAPPNMRTLVIPMSGVLIAQFVANLSATIVATALPSIYGSLPGPAEHATWVVAATILGNTASTPIWGKITETLRPKHVLQIAIAIFALGSIVAGFAPDTTILIVGRALQGIAIGGVINSNSVVVAGLTAPRHRGQLNAWTSTVQTSATLVGPLIGGLLVEAPGLGWRWCFFLSAPIAAASVVVLAFTLPSQPVKNLRSRNDVAGGLLIGISVTAALIAVSMLPEVARFGWLVLISGTIGLAGIITTIVVELKVSDPIIPLRFLTDPTIRACALAAFLVGSALFSATVFTAQFLQTGAGTSPAQSGVLLMPGAIATVVVTISAGRFMSRTARVKPVLIFGTVSVTLGNLCLGSVFLAPVPLAVIGAVLISCGTATTLQNLVLTAQNSTSRSRLGSISALVVFCFVLGGTIALVSLGTLLTAVVAAGRNMGNTELDSYLVAMGVVFGIGALIVAPSVVITSKMPPQVLQSTIPDDEGTPAVPPAELLPLTRESPFHDREGCSSREPQITATDK